MFIRHTAIAAALAALALVAGAAAAGPAGKAAPAAEPPASSGPAQIETQESNWDIYLEGQKVGRMHLKIMTVRDLVIIEEGFAATLKGKETSFDNQVVYKAGPPPRPLKGKATTRVGKFKLMEGTAAFSDSTAKTEASGFADKDGKPLEKPLQESKDAPVPAGLALTYPALMFFAPKLLPEPGQIEKVSYMEFPAAVDFPDLLFFNPDCVLVRGAASADGRTDFAIRRLFAGGNSVDLAAMTVDKSGKVLEVRLRRFTFRPEGAAAPAPPAKPGVTGKPPAAPRP